MKTKLTLALIFLLLNTVILAGRNTSSTGNDTLALVTSSVRLPIAEDESYVNDIPFDTNAIALKSLFTNLEKPEAEAYINDIPFDTEKIAAIYTYSLKNIHPEDESYVDDIPFNTSEVVANSKLNSCGFATRSETMKCEE